VSHPWGDVDKRPPAQQRRIIHNNHVYRKPRFVLDRKQLLSIGVVSAPLCNPWPRELPSRATHDLNQTALDMKLNPFYGLIKIRKASHKIIYKFPLGICRHASVSAALFFIELSLVSRLIDAILSLSFGFSFNARRQISLSMAAKAERAPSVSLY